MHWKLMVLSSFKEIENNLTLFMLAGYETISSTLSYASFILAKHPDEQEKLYEEIISVFPEDSEVKIGAIE
jgi:cytochrome P450 family 3 subfamily A